MASLDKLGRHLHWNTGNSAQATIQAKKLRNVCGRESWLAMYRQTFATGVLEVVSELVGNVCPAHQIVGDFLVTIIVVTALPSHNETEN